MTPDSNLPLLVVRDLAHRYPERGPFLMSRGAPTFALRGVSFQVERGECLAVVGESGSGKSTLARSIVRLLEPTGGEILFRGVDVLSMNRRDLRAFRRRAQIVFQDPSGSLNPRIRAGSVLKEVLRFHGENSHRGALEARVSELLQMVGLSPAHAHRFPHELSGGQRQRLAIARALSVGPELLVLDEPVSALGLSVQAQILSLLDDLRKHLDLSLVFVSHDLGVVRQVADQVAVMYEGSLMEMSPADALFDHPLHPYTRGLLAATGPENSQGGDWVPWTLSPRHDMRSSGIENGCSLHPRCRHPEKDQECLKEVPQLKCLSPGRHVSCFKVGPGRNGA